MALRWHHAKSIRFRAYRRQVWHAEFKPANMFRQKILLASLSLYNCSIYHYYTLWTLYILLLLSSLRVLRPCNIQFMHCRSPIPSPVYIGISVIMPSWTTRGKIYSRYQLIPVIADLPTWALRGKFSIWCRFSLHRFFLFTPSTSDSCLFVFWSVLGSFFGLSLLCLFLLCWTGSLPLTVFSWYSLLFFFVFRTDARTFGLRHYHYFCHVLVSC